MKRETQGCKVKAPCLQEERVLQEEEVIEMVISHHHPHHYLHLHLYPLPLLPLSYTHQPTSKGIGKQPLLKLDIKFELPMYNGEVNVENLDNWLRHLDFYCRIQNIQDDDTKI